MVSCIKRLLILAIMEVLGKRVYKFSRLNGSCYNQM